MRWKKLWSYNNIIDWYMDKFDEKSYESHDTEPYSCCNSDFLEFWNKKKEYDVTEKSSGLWYTRLTNSMNIHFGEHFVHEWKEFVDLE